MKIYENVNIFIYNVNIYLFTLKMLANELASVIMETSKPNRQIFI